MLGDIVSALGTAYTVLEFIVTTVQALEARKEQIGVLAKCAKQLLATLNTEFSESRLVPEKCVQALEDLETCVAIVSSAGVKRCIIYRLLRHIHCFVETEKAEGFLKMLFLKDARISKIEAFHMRIGMCMNAFQVGLSLSSALCDNAGLRFPRSSMFKQCLPTARWLRQGTPRHYTPI
jgi:hypothetical protein